MTSEQSHAALWQKVNLLNDELIRLQERSRSRDVEIKRLETRIGDECIRLNSEIEAIKRWMARGLMVGGSLGTGAAYIVFKQIAESAGISL